MKSNVIYNFKISEVSQNTQRYFNLKEKPDKSNNCCYTISLCPKLPKTMLRDKKLVWYESLMNQKVPVRFGTREQVEDISNTYLMAIKTV